MTVQHIDITKKNYSLYAGYEVVGKLKDYVLTHGKEMTVRCGDRAYRMTPAVAQSLN